MESLVFYKRTLVGRHGSVLSDEARRRLEGECLELLSKLEKVDPDRRQRYIDLCTSSVFPYSMIMSPLTPVFPKLMPVHMYDAEGI